ncbi:MAG: vitamin B12-dependent ribonucleotide reductase, partial [Patescibacteria group bacterium]
MKQLVGRVTETFGKWALDQGYVSTKEGADVFRDELAWLTLNQVFAWNSPVWFNVGTDRYEHFPPNEQRDGYIVNADGEAIRRPLGKNNQYPQTSACFIQDVGDTMEDIMDLAVREAMIFRHGSGTGTNLSTLRSSREKLSGGGVPSGPLAYLSFYDRVAAIVKSGGRTRRAAKWDGLDITHPDILEWIKAKVGEQRKLNGMMDFHGISYREAADSVLYQNENITVRVTDDFMNKLEKGGKIKTIPVHSKELAEQMPEYDAKFLWNEIAKSAWECADPGLQFDTTINDWHTTPNTARINASNPCSEYLQVDNSSCNLASLRLTYFMNEDGTFKVDDFRKTVDLVAKSQDMEFDISSFPTAKIARNSHRLRNLGLGYTDLGSLLMFMGLPYDSEEGRATAASITALMTGQTYLSSTEMAEKLGPFKDYDKNRDATLRVLNKHKAALQEIDRAKLPKG